MSNTKKVANLISNDMVLTSMPNIDMPDYLPLSGGNLTGPLSISNADVKILSGNYIQTSSPLLSVRNFGSRNAFIQAEAVAKYPQWGVACVGTRGYCILSVMPDLSAIKLSGDLAELNSYFAANPTEKWSWALSDDSGSQDMQIQSIDTAIGHVIIKNGLPSNILRLSAHTDIELLNEFNKGDDNAFYCLKNPEVGNLDIPSVYGQHAEGGTVKAIGRYTHAEGRHTFADARYAHAEGDGCYANAQASHAEGQSTKATAYYAHAEGTHTYAQGVGSHSEGGYYKSSNAQIAGGTASGNGSHAEGLGTVASGNGSHAEGGCYSFDANGKITSSTKVVGGAAIGDASHAEGGNTTANGYFSHAEGYKSRAELSASHAEGYATKAFGNYSHAEGNETIAKSGGAHAEGLTCIANAYGSHAEGYGSLANGQYSHVEGNGSFSNKVQFALCSDLSTLYLNSTTNVLSSLSSYANDLAFVRFIDNIDEPINQIASYKLVGNELCINLTAQATSNIASPTTVILYKKIAKATAAHAEGYDTRAIAGHSHAEGYKSIADGSGAHAEGGYWWGDKSTQNSVGGHASGKGSHAEGFQTFVLSSADAAHAEGYQTSALYKYSHAEGQNTMVAAQASHAEGQSTIANGNYSHAEGYQTSAFQDSAHAEGFITKADGQGAHAEGYHTIAQGKHTHAAGHYGKALHDQSWCWNGWENKAYESKGKGTFCINPLNSELSNVYIGANNFIACIANAFSKMTDNQKNTIKAALGIS